MKNPLLAAFALAVSFAIPSLAEDMNPIDIRRAIPVSSPVEGAWGGLSAISGAGKALPSRMGSPCIQVGQGSRPGANCLPAKSFDYAKFGESGVSDLFSFEEADTNAGYYIHVDMRRLNELNAQTHSDRSDKDRTRKGTR
ncbi:hypothetical protein GI582_13150 [Sulfitobacter sp. BDSS02]|nr:hypothetical protein [Sulfitobacter sp. BDSS02]MBR9848862.1 hypothetical protein [Paracoccaceae bacterium]